MLLKDVDESFVEKVVGVSNGSLVVFDDVDGGGADAVGGGGGAAAAPAPAAMLVGKSPPCVGGAVGSNCCQQVQYQALAGVRLAWGTIAGHVSCTL